MLTGACKPIGAQTDDPECACVPSARGGTSAVSGFLFADEIGGEPKGTDNNKQSSEICSAARCSREAGGPAQEFPENGLDDCGTVSEARFETAVEIVGTV